MTEIALIGKKIGMTREFYKTGQSVPVTVIKMEKGRIIELINEDKRGYKAVQMGFGKIKTSKLSKAMKGFFAKKNTEQKKIETKIQNFISTEIEWKPLNDVGVSQNKEDKTIEFLEALVVTASLTPLITEP